MVYNTRLDSRNLVGTHDFRPADLSNRSHYSGLCLFEPRMNFLNDILDQIESAQKISHEYHGWIMLIIEGKCPYYRYYHTCRATSQFVTPVIRVCETCKTSMPDNVWEHFRRTQMFLYPIKEDDLWERLIGKIRPSLPCYYPRKMDGLSHTPTDGYIYANPSELRAYLAHSPRKPACMQCTECQVVCPLEIDVHLCRVIRFIKSTS